MYKNGLKKRKKETEAKRSHLKIKEKMNRLLAALLVIIRKEKKISVLLFGFLAVICHSLPQPQHFLSTHITYFVEMALSTNNYLKPPDSLSVLVLIITRLSIHISGQGVKKKSMKKEIKTKAFDHSFSATKSNHFNFLATFLKKQHINKLY